jgi:8-oxo-dGTP pyrophosphatase MutT (NUDIX family)
MPMKTSAALLEYFVPGVLAATGLLVALLTLAGIGPEAAASAAGRFFQARGGSQAAGALIGASVAYALGMLSSDTGGRLIKRIARKRQLKALRSYLKSDQMRGMEELGGLNLRTALAELDRDANGECVRAVAGILRASSRVASEVVDRQLQFHTEHARMLRTMILPLIVLGAATLAYVARYWPSYTGVGLVATACAFGLAWEATDSYCYRQVLLINTSIDHLLAVVRSRRPPVLSVSSPTGEPSKEKIVGTDWSNRHPYALDFRAAHQSGRPHRSVHVEVLDEESRLLVWARRDGRLELPGGHVEWRDDAPEPTDRAAARELLEELGCADVVIESAVEPLRSKLKKVATQLNRSDAGKNNEWVDVFGVARSELPAEALATPGDGVVSAEGNSKPRWMRLDEIREAAMLNPLGINSSLALLLARRKP